MSELASTSSAATVPAIPDIKVDIIDVNATGEYSFPDSSKSLLASLQTHKKAVLISVPGAFTPTCSEKHLPGFIEHFDALSAKGVEAVYCLSVNDKFVMKAWGAATKDCAAKGIKLVADGNGEVAEAMGLSKDYSLYGMGKRSVRFAAIVVDGVISNLEVDDGPLLNSSAEHVLTLL